MAQTRVGVRRPGIWDGLLAYYRADGTPNDVINGNDLTLVNGTTYGDGIINQGFQFDGVNDYAQYNGDIGITGDFSISGWIYKNNKGTSSFIQTSNYPSPGSMSFTLQFTSVILYTVKTTGGYLSQTLTIGNGAWKHVTVVWNETTKLLDMYLNGVLVSSGITTFTDCTSAGFVNGFLMGKRLNNQFLNGRMDEIGIWNRQLTPTEVSQLYNSGNGKQK